MNDITIDRVGPMLNPPHLGELLRESMDDVGWNVTETAARLGCERGTLSRLLNGKAGVSANMALALEDIGWGTPNTGCGCRRATSLRGRAKVGPPPNGARARCAHDSIRWPDAVVILHASPSPTRRTRSSRLRVVFIADSHPVGMAQPYHRTRGDDRSERESSAPNQRWSFTFEEDKDNQSRVSSNELYFFARLQRRKGLRRTGLRSSHWLARRARRTKNGRPQVPPLCQPRRVRHFAPVARNADQGPPLGRVNCEASLRNSGRVRAKAATDITSSATMARW